MNPRVVLSRHAYERLLQMGLDLTDVRHVIEDPEWTDQERDVRRAARRNLIVVYSDRSPSELIVITIIPRTREHYTRPVVV